MALRRSWFSLVPLALFGAFTSACGEDGQALGNQCPKLPLYHFVDEGTADSPKWVAVFPDGGPLSASALKRIQDAENARCITPLGTAVSLGQDAGTGSSALTASPVQGTSQ